MTQRDRDESSSPTRGDGGSSDEELEVLLEEAEARIDRLRSEVVRRRRERLRPDDLAAQQAEIARLSEHLERAQVNWQLVREFFRSAIREQRAGAPWSEPANDQPGDRSHRPD